MSFEDELNYMPMSFRQILKMDNRITKEEDSFYLRMFKGNRQLALLNNYNASEYASGFINSYGRLVHSCIAPVILDKLASKIASNISFNSSEEDKDIIDKAIQEDYFTNKLKRAFTQSLSSGASYLALYNQNNEIIIDTFTPFRCSVIKNKTRIVDAVMFTNKYSNKSFTDFVLVEHRYERNGKYYQRFELRKVDYDNSDYTQTRVKQLGKEEIPADILAQITDIELYKEIVLDKFNCIGVYEIPNTAYNYHYPNVDLGESQFMFIMDEIFELDNARTYKEIDKNLGRGRALIPQVFANTTSFAGNNNVATMVSRQPTNSMDFTFMQPYQSLSGNEQKPLSIQFELRTSEWRQEIEGVIGDICANFGISIMDVDPRMITSGNRTDDEISALNDITISTVTAKRELAENSINDMLETISIVLGLNENIRIRWSMEGIMNKSKVIDLVTKQLENGLISKKNALKKINPDMNENQIEEELQAINNEQDNVSATDVFNEL